MAYVHGHDSENNQFSVEYVFNKANESEEREWQQEFISQGEAA